MVPSSSPGILELNPTASGASFTVPEGVFTNQFSFSFAWPSGGYVYGYGKPERKNLQLGPFQANALTPSATITLNATNSNYPYLSGTPHEAFIRMKVGSKGFGGPAPIKVRDFYTGTIYARGGVGFSNFNFTFAGENGTFGSYQPQNKTAGFSYATNQTLTTGGGQPVRAGVVAKHNPAGIAMTGVMTVEAPVGDATQQILTGVDNRNAAGTTGRIQLVQGRVFVSYAVEPPPAWPLPETGTVTSLEFDTARVYTTDLRLLPEPSQFALLGVGLMGLASFWRMRRS
jgi:hypothetical protein